MKKQSFSNGRNLGWWQRQRGRRDFLKASVIAGATATGVTALSSNMFVGTAQAATAQRQIAADQLGTLTTFYTDMDTSTGSVDLLSTNVSYLMADEATLTNGLTVTYLDSSHPDKGADVTNWTATNQQFSWPVQAALADNYVVTALISGTSGTTVQVTIGSSSFTYTFTTSGWNKIQLGQIAIPTGTISTLTLQATAGTNINMQLKSLELVPASIQAQVNAAVQSGRSTATWMRNSPVGAMYQWGQWGANPDGTQPAWPQCYANFDYNGFADRMQSMGVDFVVWSITWTQYFVAAPIASIDAVLAGRTTTNYGGTDYLGQLLQALQNRGIRVIFYYQEGHDNNPNLDWWNAFWANQVPSANHYARKEKAINDWLNIITEIGNRYGTLLDGWMFDDGAYYYPAPYDLVNQAFRAGNPDRLISLNDHNARLTDYEDFYFGEANTGSFDTSYLVNGRYTQGPFAGDYAFGNLQVDSGDWGVRTGDTSPITTNISRDQFISIAENAIQTQQAMAYDMRMWTNMTQAQTDIDYLTDAATLAHAIRDGNLYNDTDGSITYSGTGWYAQGASGAYNGDIHATTNNGDSFVFTFYGTGVDFVTETYSNEGNIDIYIDGTYTKTVSANGSSPLHQSFIYSLDGLVLGTHTLKGVKTSGSFMIVDAFNVRRVDPNQWYKLVVQNNTGYVLDTSGTPTNGTKIQMWAYQADDRQQYQFVSVGAGYYQIGIRNNPAYVVDATLPVTDGTQIQSWQYQGDIRQQFRLVNQGTGYYKIFVRYSPDYLLDASSVTDGGKVQLWNDAGNDRQLWSPVTVS